MSKFTPKQSQVINHDYGNIVVSASAGSGKTSVMIERLIRLIKEGLVDVKEVLAVTFTRLSASEMRDRLAKAFLETIKTDTANTERLRRQLADLPLAQISTIDSFCNTLTKKYFYLAGVDSAYSIISEGEEESLKQTALDDLFERLYEENDPDILRLLDIYVSKRSDKKLREYILKVYSFLESEAEGGGFLEKAFSNYSKEGLIEIYNHFLKVFVGRAARLKNEFVEFCIEAKSTGVLEAQIYQIMDVNRLIDAFMANPNPVTVQEIIDFNQKRVSLPRKDFPFKEVLSERIKKAWDNFQKLKKQMSQIGFQDADEVYNSLTESRELLQSFINVVTLFRHEYFRQKKEQNLLDFYDLAHITYLLLQIPEVIEDIRSTYKFIVVDEYQDTNGVQESIFKLLENDNLFVVGDAKQSIYGFRGCESVNFEERIKVAQEKSTFVELDTNFRSAPKIIEGVNRVFSKLMTTDTSNLEYVKHQMIYGGLYGDYQGEVKYFYPPTKPQKKLYEIGVYGVEKHLTLISKEPNTPDKICVRAVERALEQQIYDLKTKELRVVKPSDIVIILRSVKSKVDSLIRELEAAGIPTVSENKRSIKTYPEIIMLVNILQCIINQNDDIALAASLKSPVGGLTDRDLKTIREEYSDVTFYEAVLNYSKLDNPLAQKIKEFYNYLDRLRLFSGYEGVSTLIRRIMREKDIETNLISTCGGDYKLKRIEALISAATINDKELMLQEFLEEIDINLENITAPTSGVSNAVRIMSIHASKGLEFPVVILYGIGWNWANPDSRQKIILSRGRGIGTMSYDKTTKIVKDNLVTNYLTDVKNRDACKEELRLLYVAMTRAKCILYVVSNKMPPSGTADIFDCKSEYDLLTSDIIDCEMLEVEKDMEKVDEALMRDVVLTPPNVELVEKMRKYLNYSYPYQGDTKLSVKKSVTAVNKSEYLKEEGDLDLSVPTIFDKTDAITGTIYHKLLELLDFKNCDNGLIDQLLEENFSSEEAQIIDRDSIYKILSLPIFEEIKDYKLYKEQPFMVSVSPSFIGEQGDEEIILQGVIDLLCIKDGKAIIVDYKHSRKSLKSLVSSYSKQLNLYAYAVTKGLNLEIEKMVLVNINRIEQVVL